jgi:5-methylcytosine-specific restriction enzyme A
MPMLAPRSCAIPTCPNAAGPRGRCATHATERRRVRNVDHHEHLYRTARWRRLRLQVLREQPFCDEPGCRRLVDEVHHKVKRADDLSLFFERSNVVGKCRPCHAKRTKRGE